MGASACKRQTLDDEYVRSTAARPKITQSLTQLDGFPLPNEVVEHVTSFLGGHNGSFADRVRVAAVCRQLRTSVFSNMGQMKNRFLMLYIDSDFICINNIRVKNDRRKITWRKVRSAKHQMECIQALIAFAQPTQLTVFNFQWNLKGRRLIDIHRVLSSVSPLSITRLNLHFHIGRFSDETPFNDIMEVVGGMTNLEMLRLNVWCKETPASAVHRDSLPFLPEGSPFNHLLKLERLRALTIEVPQLVSLEQLQDVVNRSPSIINHLCYKHSMFGLESMAAAVRANITSVCVRYAVPPHLLVNLPNCQSICSLYINDDPTSTRQKIDEMANDLLTNCHDNDDSREKTLLLKIGLFSTDLHEYLEDGGQAEFSLNRKETVVNVIVIDSELIDDATCPSQISKKNYL